MRDRQVRLVHLMRRRNLRWTQAEIDRIAARAREMAKTIDPLVG